MSPQILIEPSGVEFKIGEQGFAINVKDFSSLELVCPGQWISAEKAAVLSETFRRRVMRHF